MTEPMTEERPWIECQKEMPPEGEVVMTKLSDRWGERNVQPMRRRKFLWFVADGSMYVYYAPTHWRRDR